MDTAELVNRLLATPRYSRPSLPDRKPRGPIMPDKFHLIGSASHQIVDELFGEPLKEFIGQVTPVIVATNAKVEELQRTGKFTERGLKDEARSARLAGAAKIKAAYERQLTRAIQAEAEAEQTLAAVKIVSDASVSESDFAKLRRTIIRSEIRNVLRGLDDEARLTLFLEDAFAGRADVIAALENFALKTLIIPAEVLQRGHELYAFAKEPTAVQTLAAVEIWKSDLLTNYDAARIAIGLDFDVSQERATRAHAA